jgi:hypothetical protein
LVKQKSRPAAATFGSNIEKIRSGGFYHGADALGAQYHANFFAIDHHRNFLKVGAEGPVGCSQGATAVVAEGCGFSTGFTLCLRQKILS